MKKYLVGLGVLAALLVTALALPALIPADAYKGQIVSQLEAVTGRRVAIGGHVRLSLLPDVEFVAKDVSVSDGPAQSAGSLASVGRLAVQVKLWPLLRGNLVIDSLVLKQPVITLAVSKTGQPNWQIAPAPGAPAASASQPSQPGADPLWILSGLNLANLRIADGRLSFRDERTGRHYEAEAITARLALPGLGNPVKAEGSLKWHGEPVSFTGQLGDTAALLVGKPAPVTLAITAPGPSKFAFQGTVSTEKGAAVHGELSLETPSVRQLAGWAGAPIALPGNGFGSFRFAGVVDVRETGAAVHQAVLALDATTAKGEVQVEQRGSRPYVMARLAVDKLDFDRYLPPASAGGAGPADLTPLRLADADLDLSVGSLTVRGVEVDKVHLVAALNAGKSPADAGDPATPGGSGIRIALDGTAPGATKFAFRGTVSIEKTPKAHGQLTLDSPSLRQLAAAVGTHIALPGNTFGKFRLSGVADIDETGIAVHQAALALDAVTAKGELVVEQRGPRPYVLGKLVLDRLDLDPYMPPPAASNAGALDLTPLRLVDADFDISAGPVSASHVRIDRMHLVAALKAGKLTADANDIALYGGRGRVSIALDASAPGPPFTLDAELSGFQLASLLRATAGASRIQGTGSVTFRGSARGATPREVTASLAGSGSFILRNGSIGGGDLAAMLRNVQGAFGRGGAKTDFTEIRGSYSIRNGVLSNPDLQVVSPLVRATGHGTINIASTYVDYRIEPRLVTSGGGIGGLIGRALPINLLVPVIVTGPIDNLSYQPDLAAAARNLPGAIPGAIGNLPRALPGVGALPGVQGLPDPSRIVKGLFGQ